MIMQLAGHIGFDFSPELIQFFGLVGEVGGGAQHSGGGSRIVRCGLCDLTDA